MDRFVTRAEAFLIPRVEENEGVGIYESRLEEADGATRQYPIRKQENGSHSPDVDKKEFVPLNLELGTALTKEQLETLEDIGRALVEALMSLSSNSQEGASASEDGASATNSSRELLNESEREPDCVTSRTNTKDTSRNPTNESANEGASNIYNGDSNGASEGQKGVSNICSGDSPIHNDENTSPRLRKFGINERSLTDYEGNTQHEGA
jgi:hypothetical protein